MALLPIPQLFLGTRLPASDFALPSTSSVQLRKSRVVWPRGELDILESNPSTLLSDSPEPQISARGSYYPEPTGKDNGQGGRVLGQDRESSVSRASYANEFEDYEEKRYYFQRDAPRTRRDVWVKPGSALASDFKREGEKKEVGEKYMWVNPNRKDKTGPSSWPERRAGIEVLHSTKDVAAALREWVISLPVLT